MPNSVQHSGTAVDNALGVGDMHVGVPASGPTSVSGFYTGINPPSGGYTVYMNKGEGGPSIVCPANDAALIAFTENLTGESMADVNACFAYFAGETDKMVMFNPINGIITDSIELYLDANQIISYPHSGTSWKDISGEGRNGTLTNGVTFNSDGYMDFDGTDDYVAIDTYTFGNGNWTVNAWVAADVLDNQNLVSNTSGGPVTNAFGFDNSKIHYRNYDGAWQLHDGNTTLTTGQWYMVTWVNYEGDQASTGTMKMFVNGVADSSEFNSYVTNGGPCNAIGRNWGSTEYDGKIANISFHSKSLTDAEVYSLYFQGSIPTTSLVTATDVGNYAGELDGTDVTDLISTATDFETESAEGGSVTYDSNYGGVLNLSSGRIYKPTTGWYGMFATSWWMKMDSAPASDISFFTESKRTSGGCARIYSYISSTGYFTFRIWDNSSNSAGMGGTHTVTTTTNVCDGNWHQITCQWSNGSSNQTRGIYVYVDGVQEDYDDIIGNDGGYQYWHLGGVTGCVGEFTSTCLLGPIQWYKNYNLTNGEVVQLYNAYVNRFN
jgi:hypothetical protein